MSSPQAATAGPRLGPADVERWLRELGLRAVERADRDGITSWDLELDGRRRFGLRVTVILDPAVGLLCWAHYAPPINDLFRRSYRKLLRWNDELPFVKFSVAEDERPILSAELPLESASADELGLTLARIVAVSDRLLDESADWLWLGGKRPAGYGEAAPRNASLLSRYELRLAELLAS
jgi:Putative bacterial sensory transduction regulator